MWKSISEKRSEYCKSQQLLIYNANPIYPATLYRGYILPGVEIVSFYLNAVLWISKMQCRNSSFLLVTVWAKWLKNLVEVTTVIAVGWVNNILIYC